MSAPSSGKVFLTGAGPGDPGLLTIRAREILERADVVLFDALASDAVLAFTPETCERIYVGKRGSEHAMEQSEIEALLIRKARDGKLVVRLKGGDPFLFGRGGEEAEALKAAGIDFAVVPGITSALAAPAYAGIPVTHRAHNTVLTIVSGHEDPGKERTAIDWDRLADPRQTLVFLMAVARLREIAARLIEHGLPQAQPAAVIADGTRPSQRTVTGTLATVADEVARAGLRAPAVLVVGTVVNLRAQLAWFEKSTLFGKRVLVTRPAEQSGAFARELLHWGAEPVVAPAIEILPPDDPEAAVRATLDPARYAWVVFTSANGVRAFFDRLDARRDDARIFGNAKIAAIGLKTAQALRARNIYPDAVPHRYVAEDLADLLIASSQPGDSVLVYRAAQARDVLPDRLKAAGRTVDAAAAYQTISTNDPLFAAQVARSDIVTFTSTSTVHGFVHNLGSPEAARMAASGKVIACIGPVTAQSARDAGLPVHVVAEEYTVEGLAAALAREAAAAF